MHLVSLVGARTIDQEEEKNFTVLTLVSLTGTRTIRAPVHHNETDKKKIESIQEQAPPVRRNGFFRRHHHQ